LNFNIVFDPSEPRYGAPLENETHLSKTQIDDLADDGFLAKSRCPGASALLPLLG